MKDLVKKLFQEFMLLIILFVLSVVLVKLAITAFLPGNPEIDIDLAGRSYLFNEITLGIVLFVILVCLCYGIRFLFFKKGRIHVGIILIAYMLLAHGLIWYYGPVYQEVRAMYGSYEFATSLSPDDPDFFQKFDNALGEWDDKVATELLYMQLAVGVFTFLFIVIFIWTLIKRSQKTDIPTTP
jgi:hypothetical protein